MKLIIKLFGVLMCLSGISLLIKPDYIIGWIDQNTENTFLYTSAIVVRLVLGFSFIATARESTFPTVLKFLGYVFIIAAVIIIFMGQLRFQALIISLIPMVKPFAPVSGLLSLVFGGFLIYAFSKTNKK